MENTDTPSALILSRQNINMLPAGTDYSQAAKGAYIVAGSDENPDVIMVASGSEVSTLVAGAELLHKDGVKTRIVSVHQKVCSAARARNIRKAFFRLAPRYLV